MNTFDEFILAITKVEYLKLVEEKTFDEWGLDTPRTLLFSKLGKAIADQFSEMSLDDRAFVFDTIELGMQSSSAELKALIATGLLEALQTSASRNPALWEGIEKQLGDMSGKYLLEWRSWGK